ncbi:MAG: cbb3-type cytochrome oxidase assembly protein CcoS [Pseudoalteromonas distincta]|tara:strand:- start:19906 stop:20151 length:246 start_codon:yes stop_codon:yes gene_type:complete
MSFLYVLVPIAVVLVIIAIWVFTWAVDSGQYDDLDGPAHSILFDDEDPAHLAAQPDAKPAEADTDENATEARTKNDQVTRP